MDIQVRRAPESAHAGSVDWRGLTYRCALGRGGIAADKHEGDGATPVGRFVLSEVYYRADRLAAPTTGLPVRALDPHDGWCDAPDDPHYNCPVTHPHAASAERLWREDGLYDVIVVLGYNATPVIAGAGSAIFIHVARPDFGFTEGCIALPLADLLQILDTCRPGTHVTIT